MPQHPPPGLGHRRTGRDPAVGSHDHPLSMGGGGIWFELHYLLLLCAHQPALSAWLFRWFVGGAVTGQGVGQWQQRTAVQSICCRSNAPASRWRIRSLKVGQIEQDAVQASRSPASPKQHRMMGCCAQGKEACLSQNEA